MNNDVIAFFAPCSCVSLYICTNSVMQTEKAHVFCRKKTSSANVVVSGNVSVLHYGPKFVYKSGQI